MTRMMTQDSDSHSRPRSRRILFAGLLIGLATVGCVTKGTYQELEGERDILVNQTMALEEELAAQSLESMALAERLDATEEKAVGMQLAYEQLVGELAAEVTLGQIEVQRVVDGIRLAVSDELLFPSGSVTLNALGRELLARVAQQIDSQKAIVSVEGHTDNVKISKKLATRYPTNWELAGARAAVVVRVLIENGVEPESLRAVSRGSISPRSSNDTSEGRARNRRTEILLRPIPKG